MLSIHKCPVPPHSLLERYLGNGGYADCYFTELASNISFPDYVLAFYTTALFKLERWILKWTISRPSTDGEVMELAVARRETFAAWNVEERRENEMLLCDLYGRTRSWLMIVPINESRTRLYFGSAVVPVRNPQTGEISLGVVYRSLLGFHQIYSVLLLHAAKRQIEHGSSSMRSQR